MNSSNTSNSIILNNKEEYTFCRDYNGYKELLDLIICSSNLYSYVKNMSRDYDAGIHISVK